MDLVMTKLLASLLMLLIGFATSSSGLLDHPVLFKMPGLKSNTSAEAKVLNSLDSLRTFPGVITLFTGRLLKDVDGFTHGLFARFPDQGTLLQYYFSKQFALAVLPQIPYLRGEDSVDYNTVVNGDSAQAGRFSMSLISDMQFVFVQNFPNEIIHMAMFRFNLGVSHAQIQSVLESLKGLSVSMPSIVLQTTVGKNLYDRDVLYSHAFVARLASENAVAQFYNSPGYNQVIEKQLRPLCLLFVEADLKPIKAT
ncbi:uncharacterized protein LOC9639793 isoform X1 [Selaginella moellendorffii]|uniref:uncharacterized protein LOC9639793 isoform X1 n=1 Tax=Selaginella moellendorffii TaxID=88036 RepID=UPI000D1D08EE|nr:uncharacterized protein LOC9639793 isoform X1 [Selaginella moellendorffii]|eukprot:XP_024515777.1 uncharacterized protein LOC9639793 isoform X1 [Selaginella moellendorffii]